MKKSYAVIGLGRFGYHVAVGLVENNEDVILCDNKESSFSDIRNKADQIYVLDSKDKIALKEAGIADLDVVIVSIGNDIESSILTVMALKELNNKKIIAKAASATHGAILEKLGVDEVIYPEKQAAKRLLCELIKSNIENVDLSANMKACKAVVTKHLSKCTVREVMENYKVKIVAVKREEEWELDFDSELALQRNDIIMLLGGTMEISEIARRLEN